MTANDDDEWHRVLDVNVVGIARVTRAALPAPAPVLARGDRQHLLGGGAGGARRSALLYAASKGAVAALTLAMAADHVREGIRVNAVTPGTADTPWVGRLLDAGRRSRGGRPGAAGAPADGPAGQRRRGRPRHRLPGSPLSASTTGTLLAVDGGMSGIQVAR